MGSRINRQDVVVYYVDGHSLTQTAEHCGLVVSTVRYHVKKAGALRSRCDALRLAGRQGRLSHPSALGSRRSAEHRARMSAAAKERGERTGKGWRLTSNGYVEFTRGPHKGRAVHTVLAEAMLGRPLRSDEVVHHMDRDRTNNSLCNLQVMTRSEHTALHRREDR